MKSTVIRKGATASIILGLGALLSACGGGGGGGSSTNNTITGYTVDGPFSASIVVYGFEGTSSVSCGSGTSLASNTGYFSIPLNPSCSGPYLVVATASSGTDAGTYYYLTNQTSNPIYVTPVSTAIVEEYAPTRGSATTVLSYFKSPGLLTSIESQENTYSNGPISFSHVSVTHGSTTIDYIYPSLSSSNSATIPILVKEFNGSSIETAFGYFSSGTLYLYSNTNSSSCYIPLSSLTSSSLSNITSSSYSSITSILSPTPMIIPVTSPTQTPNPITSSSSVIPTSSSSPIITPTSSPITSPTTGNAFSPLFSTNIYEDPGTFNVPIITVYIDGQPVNLILDTGDSGLVVNQSAVNIPSSDYISYSGGSLIYPFNYIGPTYNSSYGSITGSLASATVCLNPSITSSCVIMPIGVLTSGSLFPGEPNEGVFGLADVGYGLSAETSNGNIIKAFSYPYYLEQQTGINSYQISFISLSNNYYANISQTQPIGQISFGNYNGDSDTLTPYGIYSVGYGPYVTFGSSSTNISLDTIMFDTASPFNFLSKGDLQAAIAPNYSSGQCAQYGWPNSLVSSYLVNSSYTISYTMQSYTGSFITEPPTSFCSNPPAFNLLAGITVQNSNEGDYVNNSITFAGFSLFGLPMMLGHTLTFVLNAPGSPSQGFIEYLGISP